MAPPKVKKPVCFVVSPIGETGSPERIHADWLLEGIIKPVFAAHYPNYEIIRADKMPAPGLIDVQIIEHLLDAELVIADITTLNPNVFYEIGVRHVVNKAIIHMSRVGDPIPFDIKLFRHITFSVATPQALEAAKVALKESLDATFAEDFKVDNPVTRTRGVVKFEENATPGEQVMQEQIASLNARVALLERADNPLSHFSPHVVEALRRPAVKPARYAGGGTAWTQQFAQDEIAIRVIASLHSTRQLHQDGQKAMETYFESFATVQEGEASVVYAVLYSDQNLKTAGEVANSSVRWTIA
ncbi:hypothetical protein [Rhizobium leguminosarum]|uniref:hypothetical protein n=1 Tax=Rhizobium leguminosarum TaxID=384 RepID=UPI001C904420|nr:hypothetical protein [Rhizobium leguminosarum]MBY2913615.1 hypothetical protein [Rhizobium leguminosarum]MBY2969152.1 hypothetical protein [Rhizobium leguminosarum]MBY2976525.1 hypothetical protein [Rhizobium leguminosarum]MBY3005076.1 hypothetical protein [Rhizobium leguminosarum]